MDAAGVRVEINTEDTFDGLAPLSIDADDAESADAEEVIEEVAPTGDYLDEANRKEALLQAEADAAHQAPTFDTGTTLVKRKSLQSIRVLSYTKMRTSLFKFCTSP